MVEESSNINHYPKTWKECCKVLMNRDKFYIMNGSVHQDLHKPNIWFEDIDRDKLTSRHYAEMLRTYIQLITIRDIYNHGFLHPFEGVVYVLRAFNGKIKIIKEKYVAGISLYFHSEETAMAFCENFSDLITQIIELL